MLELSSAGKPKARYGDWRTHGQKPVRMHKGVMMESITLEGRSPPSNPALGNNALDAMHKVIAALMTLREQWGKQYQTRL